MDAMSDDDLSAQTGQAGVTVTVSNLNQSNLSLIAQDNNGLGAPYTSPGDLTLRGLGITAASITSTMDAGRTTTGQAAVDINVQSPSLTLSFNGVTDSFLGANVLMDLCAKSTLALCAYPTSGGTYATAGDYPVLTTPGVSLTLSGLNMNLQFGSVSQGHMGVITDSGSFALNVTGSNAVNMALVDPNASTSSTSVAGLGFKSLSLTGLDFGTNLAGGLYTSLDLCTSSTTSGPASCQAVNNLLVTSGLTNNGGLLVGFNGTGAGAPMNSMNLTVSNLSAGNVAAGATPLAMGSLSWTNLSLAGAYLMVTGH